MSNELEVVATIGKDGIAHMVSAFYRLVKSDDLIGPMYPDDDWEGSEERLREFLWFRLAQDPTYILKRGHPRLRMRHGPFRIDIAARDRWVSLMSAAMEETSADLCESGSKHFFSKLPILCAIKRKYRSLMLEAALRKNLDSCSFSAIPVCILPLFVAQ